MSIYLYLYIAFHNAIYKAKVCVWSGNKGVDFYTLSGSSGDTSKRGRVESSSSGETSKEDEYTKATTDKTAREIALHSFLDDVASQVRLMQDAVDLETHIGIVKRLPSTRV